MPALDVGLDHQPLLEGEIMFIVGLEAARPVDAGVGILLVVAAKVTGNQAGQELGQVVDLLSRVVAAKADPYQPPAGWTAFR